MAERNVNYAKEILKTTGLSPDRIQMFHCSSAEGQIFQEEMIRISEVIENLGSNPIKESLLLEKNKDSNGQKKKKTE
ncbi:MAG: hydrogenase iron-sulfur subunit [Candidatus Lokiarchaeota archaeon]|nr:hydrogenase iron-sulfur subunit [Candidatus Lokiarchaeota archaeon]